MPEIIPKNLVTLRFLKFLYQVLIGTCKMFQMRYWPNFYVDPTNNNAYLFKLDKWRVYLQATVGQICSHFQLNSTVRNAKLLFYYVNGSNLWLFSIEQHCTNADRLGLSGSIRICQRHYDFQFFSLSSSGSVRVYQ